MIEFPKDVEPTSMVYLNGDFIPLVDARVSPLDRGFLFADGVYEVVPVYNNCVFGFQMHFDRLQRSLKSIQLEISLNKTELLSITNKLIAKNKGKHQVVYFQVTRGVAKRNHAFPKNSQSPTIFAMSTILTRPSQNERENGITAITTNDDRWNRCDIKSISLLANVLAREKAEQELATEAILLKDGRVQEGAASNIWIVKNNTVLLPSEESNILEGVRIQIVKKICSKLNINFMRCNIFYDQLMQAEEVLLTSATKEILAVTKIDGKNIGVGNKNKPGLIFRKIQFEYDKLINNMQDTN